MNVSRLIAFIVGARHESYSDMKLKVSMLCDKEYEKNANIEIHVLSQRTMMMMLVIAITQNIISTELYIVIARMLEYFMTMSLKHHTLSSFIALLTTAEKKLKSNVSMS